MTQQPQSKSKKPTKPRPLAHVLSSWYNSVCASLAGCQAKK